MTPPEDHARLRAADSDRHAVSEILRQAAGEGRLSFEELDERLDAAYAARTFGELEPLVADLPDAELPWRAAAARSSALPSRHRDEPLVLTAGSENQVRRGRWTVPARLVLEPRVSTVKLDFRRAECPHETVHVEVRGGVGDVVLILPEDWSVDTDTLRSSWGTIRNQRLGRPGQGRPTIVVTGGIGMGTFRARSAYFYERWSDDV